MMILDIGSGPHPKEDAHVRMDLHRWPGVNCLHDLLVTPYPFNPNSFSKVYMGDVVEHIVIFEVDRVLDEVYRIMAPGAVLEITVPDVRWIAERIVKNDWLAQCGNIGWLNQSPDPWKNAMSYLYGGFQNKDEYQLAGMGHVNGFDEASLAALLGRHGFTDIRREPDTRNPPPGNQSVLKMLARKPVSQ
jgi:predicted SAM-dependent methyltransferase